MSKSLFKGAIEGRTAPGHAATSGHAERNLGQFVRHQAGPPVTPRPGLADTVGPGASLDPAVAARFSTVGRPLDILKHSSAQDRSGGLGTMNGVS